VRLVRPLIGEGCKLALMDPAPDFSELWRQNETEIERLRAARSPDDPPSARELELEEEQG
jgi:hypothetical protein